MQSASHKSTLTRRRALSHRRRRKGTAACEFAVTVPLIVMLTLTSVDLGRAIDCYTSLTNATRTGAQFGASHGHTDYSYSEWEERVIEASAADLEGAIGVNTADVAFHVSTDGASAGDAVSVETEYSFETLVAWPGLPSSFPIRTSCTFRRFR